MSIVLDGTTGITTPDVTSDGALKIDASAPDDSVVVGASGNVGIGTSSPAHPLDVAGSGVARIKPTTGTNQATLLASNTGGNFYFAKNNSAGSSYATDAYASVLWSSGAYPIVFATNGSQRARIDSSGNLLVGTTTGSSRLTVSGAEAPVTFTCTSTGGAKTIVNFNQGATFSGYISVNGSSTSYNTSSDYRLKENFAPMTGALAKVAALKPCTYTWKETGENSQGFIAHELAEVVPECVTGEKDAVNEDGTPKYQGIDTSFLVATLTAAIQEQQAIIESLTARVSALEAFNV